jgi:hypothetical protein
VASVLQFRRHEFANTLYNCCLGVKRILKRLEGIPVPTNGAWSQTLEIPSLTEELPDHSVLPQAEALVCGVHL